MLTIRFDYVNLPLSTILMYAQSLANIHLNVRSVNNYLSGAKSFVRNIRGDVTPFESYTLTNLIKGVARLSAHVPSSPPPLTVADVRWCADDLLAYGPEGVIARAALLFGVATFLRQSNFVLGPTATASHLLARRDLAFTPDGGLSVTLRSSKTIWDDRDTVVIPVAAAPGSPYCPVAACRRAIPMAPAQLTAQVFLWPGTLRPVTAAQLIVMIHAALRHRGHPAWGQVTLHSLRHMGATLALGNRATLPEIMNHGT